MDSQLPQNSELMEEVQSATDELFRLATLHSDIPELKAIYDSLVVALNLANREFKRTRSMGLDEKVGQALLICTKTFKIRQQLLANFLNTTQGQISRAVRAVNQSPATTDTLCAKLELDKAALIQMSCEDIATRIQAQIFTEAKVDN